MRCPRPRSPAATCVRWSRRSDTRGRAAGSSAPRRELQPVEAEVFSELDGNLKQEEAFVKKPLRVVAGSHLAHRDRLGTYLEQLRRLGFAVCDRGVWSLTASGRHRLDSHSFPIWQEIHGGSL